MQGIALRPPAEGAEGVWGAKSPPKKEEEKHKKINKKCQPENLTERYLEKGKKHVANIS
ncbi:MAG: hypothetical protein PHH77_03725 [Victivallaceae bacterium]|nr:hypothetical protein [Victivallaceae bacterium]